jgi:hypothetical protein
MPKPSKATAATFTEQGIRELFNTKQTSLWEKGVEYLYSQHQIESYIRFLTNSVGEVDKWVAEFSALVRIAETLEAMYDVHRWQVSSFELSCPWRLLTA